MKKIVFTLMMAAALPFAAMAQEAEEKTADQYKNEGNAFVKEKNYQDGLASYEKALELWGDSTDVATVFNAGTCATKTKQWDKAIQYFKQVIAIGGYKEDAATYNLAVAYDKNGEDDAYEATLLQGFEKFKAGKYAQAMQKGLVKIHRDKAMTFYQEGSKVLSTWTAEKDAEVKAAAKKQFEQALPEAEKALEYNPNDEQTKKIIDSIKEQLK